MFNKNIVFNWELNSRLSHSKQESYHWTNESLENISSSN